MKNKLLIGTVVVLGIAAAIWMSMLVAGALIVVWIYLVWMVRKKRANLFHDQVEPKIAERRYKMLKASLLAGGISLAGGITGVIVHNALYGLSEIEEPVSFFIALSFIVLFVIATSGGLYIFLKGRTVRFFD